jgi:DNA polymerase-1
MVETTEEIVTAPRKKLAIIDGKSVFYRGYYAMPNLATKDGTPTGGVFGFATMALEVLKMLKPDYVCVAWDKPKTNIRRRLELYPEYKAGRKPAPPDFYEQIPVLHELLDAFGWPLYELDDYEADDIMGTLAVAAAKQDIETMLITSDMDMLQLIDPHIHVFALKKGLSNIELYSPKSFEAKYGIKATQFLDLKALKGDSSDNIPGVPGIGEKGALDLLKEYKTLDGVYENLGLLKDSVRRKLEAGKDLAYLSKELADIWTNAPIELDLPNLDVSRCEPQKIHDILQRLEFRNLARQLPNVMQMQEVPDAVATGRGFSPGKLAKNVVIDTNDQLLDLAKELQGSKELVAYARTAGKHGRDPRLLVVSPSPKQVFTVTFGGLSPQHIQEALGPLFEDSTVGLVGHDLKALLQIGYGEGAEGFAGNGVTHDTQIGAFLLNPLRRDLSLTQLAAAELDYQGSPFEDDTDEELVTRAPELIAVIRALAAAQADDLKAMPKVAKLAHDIEWQIIPVLARMEWEGIQLNTDYLAKFSVEIETAISDVEQQIYGHADQEFNIGSPSQLADILFTKLNLPTQGIKKGKTGYSTAASELDKLRGLHPMIDLITQYREVTKLKNTYVDTLPKQVDEQSRVHTTFSLTVAQTGRLSSNDPNLQNIPTRTELGRRIRTAFVAGKGKVLVNADYSQFELRLAAALSGDEGMIEAFNTNTDIHVATAAAVYGIKPEEVTKAQRYSAKAVNFGIMYGQGPHGLAAGTGMSFGEAREFIDRYFQIRPKLRTYIDSLREKAKDDGYVETMLGRRRPTADVNSSNFAVREGAYRQAINMPVQGTAADLMKLAMIKLDEPLRQLGAQQLIQVHDSILVEAPADQAEAVTKLLHDTMKNIHPSLPVPLAVDTSTGPTWGDL